MRVCFVGGAQDKLVPTKTGTAVAVPAVVAATALQNIVGKMAQDVGMVESIVVSSPSSLVGF